jgi:hypothetical protein
VPDSGRGKSLELGRSAMRDFARAKQAAEKGFSAGENLAGAKARRCFYSIYGTSKLVP